MCAQNEIESCTHCVPPTPLHNPVEGEGLEQREHEQRTAKHDLWCVNREPWVTNQGSTSLSSSIFHGLSPLELHGVMIEGVEPHLAKIFMTRFQSPNRKQGSRLIKGGRCAFSVGRGRYIER